MMYFPVELKSNVILWFVVPGLWKQCTGAPVLRKSQSRISESFLAPLARYLPSGENLTCVTPFLCPLGNEQMHDESPVEYAAIVDEYPPAARIPPSGLTESVLTIPFSVFAPLRLYVGSVEQSLPGRPVLKALMQFSSPQKRREPSWLKDSE